MSLGVGPAWDRQHPVAQLEGAHYHNPKVAGLSHVTT